MSLGPLYVLLGEVSVQVLCPFLIGLFVSPEWSCVSSLYSLEIKPLSEVSFTNIFSYTVASLFILLMFSLTMKSFLFWWSPFFFFLILSFMSLALGDILVKILLHGISEIFLPMLSCRTFMVSWLIFKSFIYLEFIFVCGVSWWLSFIFLHVAVQLSQHHLLKRLFWFHFKFLSPLLNINWP